MNVYLNTMLCVRVNILWLLYHTDYFLAFLHTRNTPTERSFTNVIQEYIPKNVYRIYLRTLCVMYTRQYYTYTKPEKCSWCAIVN